MERMRKDVAAGLVNHFTDDIEHIGMLDTSGIVLSFASDVGEKTIEWICDLIRKPGASDRLLCYIEHPKSVI